MRFHFGRSEIFRFGVWSICYNCLHDAIRNETRCYFIAVILAEIKFHFG